MYLWKCWRDTRVKFFIAFGIVLLVNFLPFVGVLKGHDLENPGHVQDLLGAVFVFPTMLLWLFGWILAKDNVGADIGSGSRDFLLTRPCSRGHLLWTGWMVGMAENVVLWIVASGLIYGAVFFKLHLLGIPIPHVLRSSVFPGFWLPPVFAIFLLNFGLIYGLGYCIGVIARSGSWALIGSVIVLLGYGILESVLRKNWNIHLPELFLPLRFHYSRIEIPSTLAFLVQGCLLVAFPALAHFVLERADV